MAFTWDRTRPDDRYDFVAVEDGEHVGRIYRLSGGPQDKWWFWTCTGCQRGVEAAEVSPRHGVAQTRDEAIAALAEVWVKAKAWSARTGLPLIP